MAITLKVTPEELQSTAADFQTKNSSVKQYASDMLQLITSISGDVWSGEAATAYIAKFRGLESDIAVLTSKLEKETENLVSIATKYSSAENTNVAAAGSLSSSVIS